MAQQNFLDVNNDYLMQIISLMPGHVYWKDRDAVMRGCNTLQAIDLGWKSPKDIIGKTDFDFTTKQQAEAIRAIDFKIMETGETYTENETLICPNGEKRFFCSTKKPLKAKDGSIVGIMGISFDITAQKEAEKKLQTAAIEKAAIEKAQLDERIRTMRIFAGGIAHELRTPLASMVNAASGIVKFMPRLVESYNMAKEANLDVPLIRKEHLEILKDTAEHIVQGGEYSQTVITTMLVSAQTAAIDTIKFKNLFMVATILTALTTFYYPNPDDKALVHFNAENDFQFWGDETYMMDVIYNLVKNALFFIHQAQKGEITIWLENQKDKNIVYVKDTSIGIPKENLPRLFEGYFTTRDTGTGVGLPLVRRLMQAFNGDITCESVEGEYTTFMLTFPINATT